MLLKIERNQDYRMHGNGLCNSVVYSNMYNKIRQGKVRHVKNLIFTQILNLAVHYL